MASKTSVAPSVRASSSFAGFVSTATMRPAPTATDPSNALETDAPEPHHRHRCTGRHSRRVDHRTDTRDHRAAEDRGHLRRHVGIDPDHRAGHHDRPLGERRDPAVVVQRPAADRKTPASRLKRPGCASRPRRLTQVGPAGGTEGALATARDEDHHHLVPDGKAIDVRSDFLHHAGRLVADDGGHGARPITGDRRQVRVAQPGSRDAHQQLAGAGTVEVDLFHDEWTLVVRLVPLLPQDRGAHLHAGTAAVGVAGSTSRRATTPASSGRAGG